MATTLEAFRYLDRLRESGRTNMWGAAVYMAAEMGISEAEARTFHSQWMDTFDGESSLETRVAKAQS